MVSGPVLLAVNTAPSTPALPDALPGTVRKFATNFTTPAPVGTVKTTAPYSTAFLWDRDGQPATNRNQTASKANPTIYQSNLVLSVHDQVMEWYCHAVSGTTYAAAPVPMVAGKRFAFKHGRVSGAIRLTDWAVDATTGKPDYKAALLLWPEPPGTGTNIAPYGSAYGGWTHEVDYLEADPDLAVDIHSVSMSDAVVRGKTNLFSGTSDTNVNFTDKQWHQFVLDWPPPFPVTINATTDLLTTVAGEAHGLVVGQQVQFAYDTTKGTTPPPTTISGAAPFAGDTYYWVIADSFTATTFKLSATAANGAPVAVTTNGTASVVRNMTMSINGSTVARWAAAVSVPLEFMYPVLQIEGRITADNVPLGNANSFARFQMSYFAIDQYTTYFTGGAGGAPPAGVGTPVGAGGAPAATYTTPASSTIIGATALNA